MFMFLLEKLSPRKRCAVSDELGAIAIVTNISKQVWCNIGLFFQEWNFDLRHPVSQAQKTTDFFNNITMDTALFSKWFLIPGRPFNPLYNTERNVFWVITRNQGMVAILL